jgi:hypothetical protein
LLQGAKANGFPNELWTLKRIAAVIQMQFGGHYHPAHVWKLLHGLGWSCQVHERRPIQRDEQVIAHWKRDKWPAIKKAQRLGSYLAFLDESGFWLMSTRRRTGSPAEHTLITSYN